MLSLKPLIQLLKNPPDGWSAARPWFREVGGMGEYGKLNIGGDERLSVPAPAAFVIRSRETSKPMGERISDTGIHIDVPILIENARSHYAGETDDLLLAYRKGVCQLLEGWYLEPDMQPLRYVGGALMDVADGYVLWADRYQFGAVLTNYLPDPEDGFDGIQDTGGFL